MRLVPTGAADDDDAVTMAQGRSRPAWAEIDLAAVAHNAAVLARLAAPSELCAVVKAHGYGHGGPAVARAALAGGAQRLAVALVDEGVELRQHGVAAPVLLLSECGPDAVETALAYGLTPTLYSAEGIAAFGAAARAGGRRTAVHVKVDTGMHRVGAAPEDLPAMVRGRRARADAGPRGRVDPPAGGRRRGRGGPGLHRGAARPVRSPRRRPGRRRHPPPGPARRQHGGHRRLPPGAPPDGALRPGPLRVPAGRGCGPPSTRRRAVRSCARPCRSRRGWSPCGALDAGERPSYGRLRPLPARSLVATVPIGYADGVPRALFGAGYEVLIGGVRRPLAGMVTMDQIVVDCGDDDSVRPGDEVVLLGRQGDEAVTADDWAAMLGTISYEVVCGVGPRMPRVLVNHPDVPSA